MSGGDLPADEIRAALHRAADMAADYLEQIESRPVRPKVRPGDVSRALPESPPRLGESMEEILDDYERLVLPALTHWNHPGFMAYFGITGSAPGIVADLLAASTNVNAMLWRTSPAATELEERTCDWLRQMLGLPSDFVGHINDTASMATLLALATARQRADPGVRRRGASSAPPFVVYASDQAHSSVDKAAVALGMGLEGVRKIPSDDGYRMSVAALVDRVAEDRDAGFEPIAVVATAGTTVTTSVDPVAEIAELCRRHALWLHVDAAYAGGAAVCPEMRSALAGWEEADSVVVNPHKWLFTPFDCSVLWVRRPQELEATFSVVPEYLRTSEEGVTNLMDYGIQLGRRFRALKLWMVLRAYGVEGLAERLREHCRLARELAAWLEAKPDFEVLLEPAFSVVCFRIPDEDRDVEERLNEALLEEVHRDGSVYLSSSRLRGRSVVRVAIGNIRTGERHVESLKELLVRAALAARSRVVGSKAPSEGGKRG